MPNLHRRAFLSGALTGAAALGSAVRGLAQPRLAPPNIVVIFADDLGYGDLGCFGHPTIHTPNLDRMAAEGMKLTQFYSTSPVCTPSRAGLNTGRLPIRSGLCGDNPTVLFPNSGGGMPDSEVTTAELVRGRGYATACVGKWHLGHLKRYLPTRHGFDEYFGIPYSNDMKPTVPLLDGETVIEEPADLTTLTRRYTERAVSFIDRNVDRPFFLYFPHTFPHVPLAASDAFRDTSARGLYGDVVEELDWSVGEVLDAIRSRNLAENTLVLFTSDNGPWLATKLNGGSAGLLRGGKATTWEGGVREPCVAWWPGTIEAGVVSTEMASTLDVLPTCAALAGAALPDDRIYDGVNMLPVLQGRRGLRATMPFWRGTRLMAYRSGPWKAHFATRPEQGGGPTTECDPPELYHVEHDPSERHNVAAEHPDIAARLKAEAEAHKATIAPAPCQLSVPLLEGVQPGQIV